MTLEELWDLFPIFLVPYDSRWNEYYNEMEDSIKRLVSDYPVNRVSHIGSMDVIHYLNPEAEIDISILRDYPELSKYKGESQNADYYQFCMF